MNIKEIAKLANCSPATVSLTLKNDPRVKAEMAERIRQIIKASNYVPNANARALASNRPHSIGLVVPSSFSKSGFGYAELVEEMQTMARNDGYSLALYITEGNITEERRIISMLADRRAAVVIFCAPQEVNAPLLDELGRKTPVILVKRGYPTETLPIIDVLLDEGMHAAIKYLTELGHRRIAYMGPYPSDSLDFRLIGYQQATLKMGLLESADNIHACDNSPESGYRCGRELLSRPNLPTAIVTFSDEIAVGLIRAVFEAGLKVPDDISVMGLSDCYIVQYIWPPLTTIRIPWLELASRIYNTAKRAIEEGKTEPSIELLPTQLAIRSSCAPPSQ